jgi:hypothetical protein
MTALLIITALSFIVCGLLGYARKKQLEADCRLELAVSNLERTVEQITGKKL